jgi:hypothetical protein
VASSATQAVASVDSGSALAITFDNGQVVLKNRLLLNQGSTLTVSLSSQGDDDSWVKIESPCIRNDSAGASSRGTMPAKGYATAGTECVKGQGG